jgi:hypothetical protein
LPDLVPPIDGILRASVHYAVYLLCTKGPALPTKLTEVTCRPCFPEREGDASGNRISANWLRRCFGPQDRVTNALSKPCIWRRLSVEEPGGRTYVLLMPRDVIHRAVTDPDNHMIGYVRDILID